MFRVRFPAAHFDVERVDVVKGRYVHARKRYHHRSSAGFHGRSQPPGSRPYRRGHVERDRSASERGTGARLAPPCSPSGKRPPAVNRQLWFAWLLAVAHRHAWALPTYTGRGGAPTSWEEVEAAFPATEGVRPKFTGSVIVHVSASKRVRWWINPVGSVVVEVRMSDGTPVLRFALDSTGEPRVTTRRGAQRRHVHAFLTCVEALTPAIGGRAVQAIRLEVENRVRKQPRLAVAERNA